MARTPTDSPNAILPAIGRIDGALKSLYHLSPTLRAEDFLLLEPPTGAAIRNASLQGALYLREDAARGDSDSLSVGIYLSPAIRRELGSFSRWGAHWTKARLAAFAVAAEEVSHFHYLVHHAQHGRQLTHLELELQGEIDKFLLAYFTHGSAAKSERSGAKRFFALFELLFERFHYADTLSEEQLARYREANRLARRFILKHARVIHEPARLEWGLQLLRRFYRMGSAEKISLISALV